MVADLLDVLCCPECKGQLDIKARIITARGRTKSAICYCQQCREVVGVVRNFKCDFLHFDKTACLERLRRAPDSGSIDLPLPYEVTEEALPFDHASLEWHGAWEPWDGKYQLTHGQAGDAVTFRGEFLDAAVRLLKHPWSGQVRFYVDGRVVGGADLYQEKWPAIHWFPIAYDLPPGEHTVKIEATGEKNPAALGRQVLFHELVITRPAADERLDQPPKDVNRVLPLFPAVVELMKTVPEDGLILDCGGSDRKLADPRYINVDSEPYQLPAVYASVLKLPFKSDSFDLVFSQALLEHVPDPFAAVEEMVRVTKPGGKLWAGMAFMQPVHAVPGHYFNATAWGLQELFRAVEVEDVSWFGELSFTIDWLLRAAGVAEQVDAEEYRAIMDRIKDFDKLVSYEALRAVASGVAVRARKPA